MNPNNTTAGWAPQGPRGIEASPEGVSEAEGFANYAGVVTDERSEEGTSPEGFEPRSRRSRSLLQITRLALLVTCVPRRSEP